METVKIVIPSVWYDTADRPWTVQMGAGSKVFSFPEVLLHTLRKAPYKTLGDSEQGLEVIDRLKQQIAAGTKELELLPSQYDWMLGKLKESAWAIWNGPDGVYLIRQVERFTKREPVAPVPLGA